MFPVEIFAATSKPYWIISYGKFQTTYIILHIMVEKDLQLISCLIIRPIQVLESYGQFKIFWNIYLFPIEQMSTIVELCSRVAGYTKTICEHSCNLLLSRIEESVQTFSILLDICYEKLGPGFADLSVF